MALSVQTCCPSDRSSITRRQPRCCQSLLSIQGFCTVPTLLVQWALASPPPPVSAMNFREPLPYLTTLSEYQASLIKHWPGHATTPAKPSCLRAAQSTGSVSPCCSNLPSSLQLLHTLTTLSVYRVILTPLLPPPSHPACVQHRRPGVWRFLS